MNIEYHGKIYITLKGKISKNMKKKLNYIMAKYNQNDIIINTKMVENKDMLFDQLIEYK